MSNSQDVVRSFYDALGRGDLHAVVELLDPDLEWTEAERFPYYGGTWRAPQQVVEGLFEPLAREWSRFVVQPAHYVTQGDQTVSFGVYLGIHGRSGRSVSAPFAHHWTVRDGRITRFVQYTDTAKVLEATGV